MSAPMANAWQEIGDFSGPPGAPGTGVTDRTIEDGTGALLVTLSTGQVINAGRAQGLPGGGIDFESSVASFADLPASVPYGEARYVRDTGHLYVFEAAEHREEDVDGWTDVGPIRGEAGPPGSDGADGVSITGSAIDANGHLIVSLSSGTTLDAGVARGSDGRDGQDGEDGAPGAPGTDGMSPIAYPAGQVPDATVYRVGQLAIGGDGKLLRAV